MSAIWDKKSKVYDRRKVTTRVEFRTMSMVSKEELIKYINDPYGIKKRKAKCLKELDKRGIKLRWTENG